MAQTTAYWLHTLSPTHVGTGRGIGYIDLPVHREKVTGWPAIPASAFKGVWCDHHRATDANRKANRELGLAFGRAGTEVNSSNAGALVPTDARIVCLPVRSYYGTFAWCTSPMVLSMLRRDLTQAGMTNLPAVPVVAGEQWAQFANGSKLVNANKIYLEDLDFDARQNDQAELWAQRLARWIFPAAEADQPWREAFGERFLVVHDGVFDFLCETGTEVATRVHLDDETKTVMKGQLWNEEALPAETILAGLISCDRVYEKDATAPIQPAALLAKYATGELHLQVGGKATTGRGHVRCVFTAVPGAN